jgi:hypothetical protein
MDNFLNNVLSMVIIGDEENKIFDGNYKTAEKTAYLRYHRDAIKKIIKEFNKEGYKFGKIDYSQSFESGFDLINQGHILFVNCSVNDSYLAYLFIPNKITSNQIKTLKSFEQIFQKFESLYLMQLDDSKDQFISSSYSNNFTIDLLMNTKRK